jgi:glycine/D-amino acid oxidase-like deaminating enzyme
VPVFHPDVYRTDLSPRSWWAASAAVRPAPALAADREAEVAIIGGGYAGLSAALHLARDHGIEAVVLDAGALGWGASGRNGGFVTYPAMKMSAEAMIRRWGEAETRRFLAAQAEGVDVVRSLLASEGIAAAPQGDATYEVAHHPAVAPELEAAAVFWRERLGLPASYLRREEFLEIGHGGTEQFGAFRLAGPFALHPLRYLAGLREAAERHGAALHGDSRVLSWTTAGGRHTLETAGGRVRARRVVLATNGYTPDDLKPTFANRTLPALSNIVVTRPLTEGELAAAGWRTECPVSNARDLLFYYRLLPDRRFLFGARGGTSGSPTEDMRMKAWLIRRLGEVFPAWAAVDVEYFWNGLVCLTGRRTPAIGRLPDDPTVHYGFGWHGNGVAAATWAGRRLAAAVAEGGSGPVDVPAPMAGLPPSLLHPLLRRLGLKAAYAWYGAREALLARRASP